MARKARKRRKPARTYTITHANGEKDIIVAEKLEVLEGGTLGLYGKPNDIDPFVIVSPHNYREIILNPPVYDK
jgi:hypothetical protein